MDPIHATIGGRALKLRLTIRSLRKARAQEHDMSALFGAASSGDVVADLERLPLIIYIAAMEDQPGITLGEIDSLFETLDLRELGQMSDVVERIITPPDAEAAPAAPADEPKKS